MPTLKFPWKRFVVPHPVWTLHGATERLKAILSVTVIGPAKTSVVKGLLDTGADDTVLPDGLASHLGVDLSVAPTGQCATAGGAIVAVRFAEVHLRLHDGTTGLEWPARVAFGPLPSQRALLGVAGCLLFFDTSFKGHDELLELTANPLFPLRS